MAKLNIVRGLPGSGKTTFAKTLGCLFVEADMYFIKDGEYKFIREEISLAHASCYEIVKSAITIDLDITVSNTFVKKWELQKYIDLAKEFNYDVIVYRTTGNYISVHDVPNNVIENMRNNFENEILV